MTKHNFENEKWSKKDEEFLIDHALGTMHDADVSVEDYQDWLDYHNERAEVKRTARGIENKCRRLAVQLAYAAANDIIKKVAAYVVEKHVKEEEAILHAKGTMDGDMYETIVALRRVMRNMMKLAKSTVKEEDPVIVEPAGMLPQAQYVTQKDLENFKKDLLAALRK